MAFCHYLKLLLFLSFLPCVVRAQYFTIQGKVTDTRLEPLAFASIQVKNLQRGAITRDNGLFELKVEEGVYELVISMTGYVTQVIKVTVTGNITQHVILEKDVSRSLSDIVVRGKIRDRAEEIVRQVIDRKDAVLEAPGDYSCNVYIKAVQYDSGKQAKKAGRFDTARVAGPDVGRMAMAEVSIRLDRSSGQRIREERLGVKRAGVSQSLFYLTSTEGDFNFYNNLVRVPGLSTIPFLSPVSYSGLMAYRFKTVKTEQVGRFRLFTISVKPRQISNATVQGEITISDSAWVITHTRFRFPAYHLPEYDFFEVEQEYSLLAPAASMITRQQFSYYSKAGHQKLSGKTTVAYTAFELRKTFPPRHFGTEVSATTTKAYEQDSSFWQQARTEPLTAAEVRLIRYRDSLYRATHTQRYLDSIDHLTNKVTWQKMAFLGQSFYNRPKERTWFFPSLPAIYSPIAFGGSRINPYTFYNRTFPSRKNITVYANLSYGLRNHDLNGNLNFSRMYNPFNQGTYSFTVKRGFEFIYAGDAWINLLKRSNLYLANSVGVGHSLEIRNGLVMKSNLEVSLRRSLSGYKTGQLVDSLFGSVLEDNQAPSFQTYNAVYGTLRVQYTPFQRYIREPKQKVILGSAWPTFYVQWRKGLPHVMSSKVDFDYLEFGIEQQIQAGLLGTATYSLRTGSFLSKRDLRLVDYQFMRRGDPLLFLNPELAFQALDSSFAVFRQYYQGHLLHNFNGAVINRIPLLKKLQLREVGGGGFLIAPERKLRYVEAFAGVERVFQWPFSPLGKFKLGVYVVGSAANRFANPVQFKIGITSWDKVRNKWQ